MTVVTRPEKRSLFRAPVVRALTRLPRGQLRLELPDGTIVLTGTGAEAVPTANVSAVLRVRREAFFRKCVAAGDIGFAEAYIEGDWDTPDLTAVIAFFVANVDQAPTLSGSRRAAGAVFNLFRLANRLGHLARPNTRRIARQNIREHYDLSNDFFQLWLDPSLMYSAAKWPAGKSGLSLVDAQREKNDALCRKLRLQPTDHVLEIGTGWGGWALHAATQYGCRITTVTNSQQQFELARQRVLDAGLSERVAVHLGDFRDITGVYDKIVSIEMVEALGHRYQPAFARVVSERLKPDGLVALQFITCPDARYAQFRRGVDFIQKHIFPGSLLISLNRMNHLLSHAGGFVLNELDDFGPDYARTLRIWREQFKLRIEAVRTLGFDERFIRKWTYYLSYCEAAFAHRNISVVHALYTRPNNATL